MLFPVYNLQVRPVIVLFAKAPRAGRVKTRLCPPLSPAEAADLHLQFTLQTLKKLSSFGPEYTIELHTDVDSDAWRDLGVSVRLQCEGNLADRMLHAVRLVGTPATIVGSDAPALPARYLKEILESDADVTLGPTEDGGYYAIAFRVDPPPEVFTGVRWSSEHTLEDTVKSAEACGLNVALGRECWDVDSPADLNRYLEWARSVPSPEA